MAANNAFGWDVCHNERHADSRYVVAEKVVRDVVNGMGGALKTNFCNDSLQGERYPQGTNALLLHPSFLQQPSCSYRRR